MKSSEIWAERMNQAQTNYQELQKKLEEYQKFSTELGELKNEIAKTLSIFQNAKINYYNGGYNFDGEILGGDKLDSIIKFLIMDDRVIGNDMLNSVSVKISNILYKLEEARLYIDYCKTQYENALSIES